MGRGRTLGDRSSFSSCPAGRRIARRWAIGIAGVVLIGLSSAAEAQIRRIPRPGGPAPAPANTGPDAAVLEDGPLPTTRPIDTNPEPATAIERRTSGYAGRSRLKKGAG